MHNCASKNFSLFRKEESFLVLFGAYVHVVAKLKRCNMDGQALLRIAKYLAISTVFER